MIPALHDAIREDKIFPVLFSVGAGECRRRQADGFHCGLHTGAGTEHTALHGEARAATEQAPERHVADADALSLFVFKTVSDPFAGRISYFKVFAAC